jgi:hypothetical protein
MDYYLISNRFRLLAILPTILLLLWGLNGCGISEQVQQAKAFKGADIRLASVEQITLAGVEVSNLRKATDISTLDQARIAAAYATGNLPLRMRVNLEVKNTSSETAALNAFDYIALLDGKEVATGRSTERIEVAPNGVTLAPLNLTSNLREVLGEQAGTVMSLLGVGLSNQDQKPLHLTLRLKPTFVTSSGRTISPTGYVNLEKEFTVKDLKEAVDRRDSLRRP